MDKKKLERWAQTHLPAQQGRQLREYREELKEAEQSVQELWREIRKLEHGDKSAEQAFADEMALLQEAFKPGGKELDPSALKPKLNEQDMLKFKQLMEHETTARFFHIMANRIPMDHIQQLSVFTAMTQGEKAPINPYDYQSMPPEQASPAVRRDTLWLRDLLVGDQYETYIEHFLAEIELIRFKPPGDEPLLR